MLSHSVLLVIGGALLTGLLGALVFGSTDTPDERRRRDERKLLRALEAQRRIRDVQLMRAEKRRPAPRVQVQAPTQILELPVVDDAPTIEEESVAEIRAAERQRKRDEEDQAAALKAERDAEKRAQRAAEHERKSAAKAERATLRAAERQEKQEAKAAFKAEQAKERAAEAQAPPPPAPSREPEPKEEDDVDQTKPLAELPLFSWAHSMDDEPPSREAS